MAVTIGREQILDALHQRIAQGKAIVGFGAGCGMTARSAERGGADYISLYTTAACRIKGVPSFLAWLPYGDVNEEMRSLSADILPLIHRTPCVAGLGAHDPRLCLSRLVDEFIAMGYSGISNEPFCSTYGPEFCRLLDEAGIGFAREVELIQAAHSKNIFTVAWAADREQALAMERAGADVIGILAGLPRLSQEGEEAYLERVLEHVSQVNRAVKAVRSEVITLVHGGPINDVRKTDLAQTRTGVDGCATGSGGERIPAERAIEEITRAYRSLSTVQAGSGATGYRKGETTC